MKDFKFLVVIQFSLWLSSDLNQNQVADINACALHIYFVAGMDHVELNHTRVDHSCRRGLHHVLDFLILDLD